MMMNMYIYIIFSFFMWSLGMWMYLLNQSFMFEWLIMSIFSFKMIMLVYMDWMSMIFMSVVIFISFMILIYSVSYMMGDKCMKQFYYLMNLFILSMLIFIISPNLVSLMFGWDGLGLVSYLLVIYYQNYMSSYSGMVTILMNRMGDIMILMVIGLMIIYGGWNFYYLKNLKFMIFFIIMAGMTKSAQFPFSSWLPMAMAAPTPVSALVHSSTLVAAGIYLLIRVWDMLLLEKMDMLLMLSVLTMCIAGLMALVENDLKKIIALSTMSQMGLMMMILSMGVSMMAFYHLLIHAIFKSLMFMSVGVIIHLVNNSQDLRLMGGMFEFIPFTMMSMLISLMSLCGVPFMSGFYSKDLMLEMMYLMKVNMFIMLMIIMSLMLTFMYSIRVIMYLYMVDLKFSLMNFKEDWIMGISMISLTFMSIFMGSLLNWLFFMEMVFLKLDLKSLVMMIMIMGIMMSIFFSMINLISFYKVFVYISAMMFYNFLLIQLINSIMLLISDLDKYHKKWFEFYSENFILVLIYFYDNYFMNFNYKIYGYMFMIIFSIIMFGFM